MAFVFMLQDRMNRQTSETFVIFGFVFRLVYAIPAGFSFAAIYWLINQKRVTGRFFLQPGHWFLAGFAIQQVGMLAVWFPFVSSGDAVLGNGVSVVWGCMAAIQIAAVVILFFGVVRNHGTWRWLLGIVATVYLVTSLNLVANILMFQMTTGVRSSWINSMLFFHGLQILMAIGYVIGIIILTIAMLRDYTGKTSRDWLHWVGALMVTFHFIIMPMLTWIMSRLLTPSEFSVF